MIIIHHHLCYHLAVNIPVNIKFAFFQKPKDGVRTSLRQGGVYRLQARPEEPAREHRAPPGRGMRRHD